MHRLSDSFRELVTARLRLRASQAGDAPAIFESFGSDSEVTRYLRWHPHESVVESQRALEGRIDRLQTGVEFSWLLVLSQASHLEIPVMGLPVIGVVSLWPDPRRREAELGFALAQDYWGRGLMLEAVEAVIAWAFEGDAVERIVATCDVDNHASARLLEKAGMVEQGLLRDHLVRPNLGPGLRDSRSWSMDQQIA